MDEVPEISAFRRLIDDQVVEFIDASRQIGEPLLAMANMVRRAFDAELTFIIVGLTAPCPDNNTFTSLIQPLSETINEIQEFRNRNRHVAEFFNHLSTVSESIVALSWISVKPAPVQFVRDMRDAGEYFGNRVLSENRGNQQHQTWINKWIEVMRGLENYVREYHLTGFSWNAYGRSGMTSAPPRGPAPPPPPPPSGSCPDPFAGGDASRHALLTQLNQGVGITQMLRPVRRGMMGDGDSHAQPAAAVISGVVGKPQLERTFPPKFILEGRKWRVEHMKDNFTLSIESEDMSQSVAMFKCQNVGLEIKNKVNGVSIDNCKRSTIVLNDIISSVELIRCENLKIQCSGHVPLISLDNCDSIQVFLTEKSIDAEVISSKSTSLNVCLLAPDGDYTEIAVPEQIKTVVVDRKLKSTVVEKI